MLLVLIPFLVEKVHVVWAAGEKRLRSPVYIICSVTVGLYFGIITLLFFGMLHAALKSLIKLLPGRISQFRDGDKACMFAIFKTLLHLLPTPRCYWSQTLGFNSPAVVRSVGPALFKPISRLNLVSPATSTCS
jgi:hypothetical protein